MRAALTICFRGSRLARLAPLLILAFVFGCSRVNGPPATPEHDPLFDDETESTQTLPGFPDPLEGFNRKVLFFNEEIDRWVLDPVTRIYRFLVPGPVKQGLRNAVANINSPVVLANDVLQLELHDAAVTVWRFVFNTTFGIGGLFDVGAYLEVPRHSADFDQTMAIWGVPSGPFLMLPVLGPTTARGMAGLVVDLLFRPTAYLLGPADQLTFTIIHGGGSGLATREAVFDQLRALHETSVDYYAALRNAYFQNRTAEIWARYERPKPSIARAVAEAEAGGK